MLNDLGLSGAHLRTARGPSSPYLDGVVASTVFDLDATQLASYDGTGQVWFNLAMTCADGSSPSAYDLKLGNGVSGASFPAFIGTAGTQSAYWTMDGGDYFQLNSGTNTGFTAGLHKTSGGSDWWLAIALRTAADDSTTTGLITTQSGTTQTGMRVTHQNTESIALIQRGSSLTTSSVGTSVLAGAADHLILVSYDHALGKAHIFVDNDTPEIFSHSFNDSTLAPSGLFSVGLLTTSPSGYLDNGTRLYSVAMGNAVLTPAHARKIINHLNARHGRTYG